MKIRVNGTDAEIEEGLTVSGLLSANGIDEARTVVELNGRVLERAHFGTILIREADRLELVRFVGGG